MRQTILVICGFLLYGCDSLIEDLEIPNAGTPALSGPPSRCAPIGDIRTLGAGYDAHIAGGDSGYLLLWATELGQPYSMAKFSPFGEADAHPPAKLLQSEDGVQFVEAVNNGFLVASTSYQTDAPGFLTKLNREGDPLWSMSQADPFLAAASRRDPNTGLDQTTVTWTGRPDELGHDDFRVMLGTLGDGDVTDAARIDNGFDFMFADDLAFDDGVVLAALTTYDRGGTNYQLHVLRRENGLVTKSLITRGYASVSSARFITIFGGDAPGALWVHESADRTATTHLTLLNRRNYGGTDTEVADAVRAATTARDMLAAFATDESFGILLSFISFDGGVEARFLVDAQTQYIAGAPQIVSADANHFALAWTHLLPTWHTEIRVAFMECQ